MSFSQAQSRGRLLRFLVDNLGQEVEAGTAAAGSYIALNSNSEMVLASSTTDDVFKVIDSTNAYTTSSIGIGADSPEAYLDIKNIVDDGATNRTMLRLHNYRSDDANTYDWGSISIDFDIENLTGGAKNAQARISAVAAPVGGDSHADPEGETSSGLIFSTMLGEADSPYIGELNEAMRINHLGNVGIGTNDPQVELHIESAVPSIRLSDSDATDTQGVMAFTEWYKGNDGTRVGWTGFGSTANENLAIYNQTPTGSIDMYTSASVRMLIEDTGSVRIKEPEIVGGSAALGTLILERQNGHPSIVAGGDAATSHIVIDSIGKYVSLNHYSADDVRMCNGGGDVGIGPGEPSYKLDVAGDVRVTDNLYVDDRLIAPGTGLAGPAWDSNDAIDTYYAGLGWLDVNDYDAGGVEFYEYWHNYDGSSLYHSAGYYMDATGRVHLRGMVETTSTSAGTYIYQLPAAYRPSKNCIFAAWCVDGNACRINVASGGIVYVGTGFTDGANRWLSLEGISFDRRAA